MPHCQTSFSTTPIPFFGRHERPLLSTLGCLNLKRIRVLEPDDDDALDCMDNMCEQHAIRRVAPFGDIKPITIVSPPLPNRRSRIGDDTTAMSSRIHVHIPAMEFDNRIATHGSSHTILVRVAFSFVRRGNRCTQADDNFTARRDHFIMYQSSIPVVYVAHVVLPEFQYSCLHRKLALRM